MQFYPCSGAASARLPNDETECVAERAGVCEQRSLDSIVITDNGLLSMD